MRARWLTLGVLVACKHKTTAVDEPVPVLSPAVTAADASTNARSIHGLAWGTKDVEPSTIPALPLAAVFRGKTGSPVEIEVVDWKGPDYEQHELHFFITPPATPCHFTQFTDGFVIGLGAAITPGRTMSTSTKLTNRPGAPLAVVLWEEPKDLIHGEGAGWVSAIIDSTSPDEVRGRIFAWFEDPAKSMIAGTFVAKACNISPMKPGKPSPAPPAPDE